MKPRLPIYICLLVLLGSTAVFSQQSGEQRTYRLSLPQRHWSLDVSLADFIVINEEAKGSGPVYDFNAGQFPEKKPSSPRMVNLRIHMEAAQLKGSAVDLRDVAMKKAAKNDAVDKASLKASEYGQVPLMRYTVDLTRVGLPNLNGGASQHKNLEAFFVKDDVWITVALTALPFKKEDEKFFYSILDSVKIIDNTALSTSFDYYQKGRSLFLQSAYREAIEPLSKALKLEQQKVQLTKPDWRNLVLELANSYGSIGDKQGFDEVLEYGLNNDPDYYRFHFTRARMYASEDKLDETIASLEKAFLYQRSEPRAIQIVEPLADPLFDPAFARFSKIDRFRKAVKAMKK